METTTTTTDADLRAVAGAGDVGGEAAGDFVGEGRAGHRADVLSVLPCGVKTNNPGRPGASHQTTDIPNSIY